MRNYILMAILLLLGIPVGIKAQNVGIKSNLLYWGTSTPNLSIEMALSGKITLDITGAYNPFTFNDNKKLKHWLVQPEIRWWTCEKFNGSFFGFHIHHGVFNAGGIELPLGIFKGLKNHRYEGTATGTGFSYGHQWYLGNHWNIEAQFGYGYTYIDYDRYACQKCGPHEKKGYKHYFGPTKLGISFIYLFKSKK